ncbi:hypothetical protein WICMUC_001888 [Wickerhamomyces mucosus]|uniref:NADH dehydrogenase [ubiquinone] 1 alpha subcomplex subunit n=1 Tax=Wickerhamomyces mucosus TaxID=1378264 RepID=A0A9P8TEZ9_9ASCO|nr:hypothetical protein WICMUC_001888 [Wickerhamomyces mucosus]
MDRISRKVPLILRLYHFYFSLRSVPFRKKWFLGYDLEGNSYWEFQLSKSLPKRRMVKQLHKTGMDFQLNPRWLQWLRFTRKDPPKIEELVAEEERIKRVKYLAHEINEKHKKLESAP